jgi:hypothetical protein
MQARADEPQRATQLPSVRSRATRECSTFGENTQPSLREIRVAGSGTAGVGVARIAHVSDAPLPDDAPRLRTLETYLLQQLAAVRRALAHAEQPTPGIGPPDAATADAPRWHLQWLPTGVGQPRRGVLHHRECFAATGEPYTAAGLAEEARRVGPAEVDLCHACRNDTRPAQ